MERALVKAAIEEKFSLVKAQQVGSVSSECATKAFDATANLR